MDIVITSRHAEISDRLRRHVEEKLAKVGQLSPRARRVEVTISHEANPRQASQSERIELTVRDRGPVIRAEAAADDVYGALDLAQEKLVERLRRVRDKRKDHGNGRKSAAEMRAATFEAEQASLATLNRQDADHASAEDAEDSPVTVREKVHHAPPMTLDDALYQMELVGHDFYLFIDAATGTPSVVYRRRRGWSYGVLRLDPSAAEEEVG